MQTSQNKKVIVAGVLAATLSLAAVFLLQPALAQTTTDIPDLNGSVSINNATNEFIKENVKVSFGAAAETALGQAQGSIISGHLAPVQGYLTYVFKVANYDAGTYRIVIVDAGNGSVLYTSEDLTLRYGGFGAGCGQHGGFGHGNWMGKGDMFGNRGPADAVTSNA